MKKKQPIKMVYPLTPMQEGILFHSLFNSESNAYFEQMIIFAEGKVDHKLFEKAFNLLIERYDILRTIFLHEKIAKPRQVVLNKRTTRITFKDFTNLEGDAKELAIKEFKENDWKKKFKLSKDLLMRIAILQLAEEKYEIIWSYHHILMDGWCMGIIMNDFLNIYRSLLNNQEAQLSKVYPFGNYVKWLEKQNKKESFDFWKSYLNSYDKTALIPIKVKRFVGNGYIQAEEKFELGINLSTELRNVGRLNEVTLNTLFQTIWGILLQKYNNVDDVVFGSVVSGRPSEIKGIEKMVGLFINTIPVRINNNLDETFSKLIKRVQKDAIAREKFSYSPLADIQSNSETKQNLITHIMAFENYPLEKEVKNQSDSQELPFRLTGLEMFEQTNYGFNVSVGPSHNLSVKISYNGAIYDKKIIANIGNHFLNIVKTVVLNNEIPLKEIDILTNEEKELLLYKFNDTDTNYPTDKTIPELFAEQVANSPEKIALNFGNQKMNYLELNNKANQLARVLIAKGVKADDLVGMMVEPSFEMFIGIFGILKAGGAYVPIDPAYPQNRIEYILNDCNTTIILAQPTVLENINFNGEIIDIKDTIIYTDSSANLVKNSDLSIQSSNLAYVMYTSGTTGEPKGNLTSHKNVIRVVKDTNYIEITDKDNLLQLSNYAFDGSTFGIFGALLNGAELTIVDKETALDLSKLSNLIKETNITLFFITTALFNTLVDLNLESFAGVRKILFGGERVSVPHVLKALKYLGKDRLIHVYGPTESTVFATYYFINEVEENAETIVIGTPIANTQVYIMDRFNHLASSGVVGELCISGDGLARGYLGKPNLTKEKFVYNPLILKVIYRTGDLAKRLPDGNIEFVGRMDNQVKLRGFRIELGEIENKLLNHKFVKEAVVVDQKDETGNMYLSAYFLSDCEISNSEFRNHLSHELPEYMIPSYFIRLEQLPLTLNGKVDKRALPKPDNNILTNEYIAPRNEIEEKLANIWVEILGVKKVGITDNFFELGGHSLKATSLVSRINKDMDVELPLREIFKTPTITELAKKISSAEENMYSSIEKVGDQDFAGYPVGYYPVSSAQKRVYVINQLEKNNTSYNMPNILKNEGTIDVKHFEEVVQKLIKRHNVFRTSFVEMDGEIVQKIDQQVDFKISHFKIEDETKINTIIKDFIRPFDLSQAPLLRVGVIECTDCNYIMLDMHHIISDGTSMGILTNEFVKLYSGIELPELKIQYKDFSIWQNNLFKSEFIKKQEEYWLKQFSDKDEIPVLNMPTDYPRPSIMTYEGALSNFEIGRELKDQLINLANKNGATLFMVLLSAYNILLSNYTGQEDIIVGSPIAGRPHADLENIIGMFVNTLAMRNKPKAYKTYLGFLNEIKENSLQAYENQDYQFDMLVEKLDLRRDLSRNPLFDAMFVLQNFATKSAGLQTDLMFKPFNYNSKVSKFDITLTASELIDGIKFSFEYRTRLFKRETIERFSQHFINILQQIVDNPVIKLEDIEMISEDERYQLVHEFNSPVNEQSEDQIDVKTIHQLFEEQVAKTPDNIALIYKDQKMTYQELNQKANQLARVLKNKQVKSEQFVGIMVERSFEMIIGLLGILKAGGAYLPIDPEYPTERIEYMLKDTDAKILLTSGYQLNELNFDGVNITLDDLNLDSLDNHNLEEYEPNNLAYIIYTSGSTGKPKGVMIEHNSIFNTLTWRSNYYQFDENDTILQIPSFAFDSSVEDIFTALISGSKLVLIEQKNRLNLQYLNELILETKVTHFLITPNFYNTLLKEMSDGLTNLKAVLKAVSLAGESFTKVLVEEHFAKLENVKLFNEYGPTENSVCTSIYEFHPDNIMVSIGKPIDNVKCYVLSKQNKVQPIGVHGELCVSGSGLSRGYLNRPELTEEKFVQNPFNSNEKIYRTGDLVRWLPDGNIEFLGRIDHQVKIRGFRIELGEIESRLLKHDSLKEVVIIDREDENGNKYLAAYLVVDAEITITDVRKYLSKELPEYMIPSHFIILDKMPLTSNGKINRKALPEPDSNISQERDYVLPTTKIEKELANIWSRVLKVERISIIDNFFELGGHSLKAMQVVAQVSKGLNVGLPLTEIFKTPTVKELAEYIRLTEKNVHYAIDRLETNSHGYYPVSSAQKRMIIINQLEVTGTNYNMPGAMFIEGNVDVERLQKVFNNLIKRHESLRTFFEMVDGEVVQKIHQNIELKLEYLKIDEDKVEVIVKEFVKPFDLSKAPLLRVGLFEVEEKHLLLFDMHHIISDGISMDILTKEFIYLYEGRDLPELRIQYKDFAAWQNKFFESEKMKKQEEYWLETFVEEIPVLNMPIDYPRPAVLSFAGDSIGTALPEELSTQLRELANKNGATLFMILLSAYNVLLSKYTGQEDIVLGTPIAGRPHADLENLIGMFVNTLALRNYPDQDKSFAEFFT
ncbi:MAG: amino acid adenylation domain-containing protein, partial [Halanaerobiales bacterium]|nr:amino acid adenylation domain-containing protein [Halanaerobiales bacterium]